MLINESHLNAEKKIKKGGRVLKQKSATAA